MKTLRVNTYDRMVQYEEMKLDYKGFGNRGLVARVALDEIPPACDPLGPENKLILAQSLMAGTVLTTSGRMSVGGKSPLTGGIKESNVGGMVGKNLIAHGIRLLIVEGSPNNGELFVLLVPSEGTARLIERKDLSGMGNYALVDRLRKDYGEKSEMLVCGPAGEKLYRNACILSTDFSTGEPCRAAGRGGLGAVMRAKGLKAIVVEKASKPYIPVAAKPADSKAASTQFHRFVATNGAVQARAKYGTFGSVRKNEETGILPVKNFRSMHFSSISDVDAQAIVDHLDKNGGKYGLACQAGCIIKCSNYYVDAHGHHTASSFNYETLALCGTNCMIESLDDIAEIKQICDDFGIDTIEMGAALGLLMEAGIIPWGDGQNAIHTVKEIASGGEFSEEMGMGLESFGRFLGVNRIPAVRGQAFPGYDVRAYKGMGLSFLAGTMGADHTVGSGGPDTDGSYVQNSVSMMKIVAAFDNITCLFLLQPMLMDKGIMSKFFEMLSAFFDETWDMDKLLKLGADTLAMEYRFNEAAGIGAAHMPDMFTGEKSEITGGVYDIDPVEVSKIRSAFE